MLYRCYNNFMRLKVKDIHVRGQGGHRVLRLPYFPDSWLTVGIELVIHMSTALYPHKDSWYSFC
jgi:hypothetical protein